MKLAFTGCLIVLLWPGFLRITSAQTPPSGPLGDTKASATTAHEADQTRSLADIARSIRKNKQAEIQMSPEDAKELFRSVDKIFEFASEDSGPGKEISGQAAASRRG
jgi:hypothetical protein